MPIPNTLRPASPVPAPSLLALLALLTLASTLVLAGCGAAPAAPELPSSAPMPPVPPAAPRGTEPMTSDSALALWYAGADELLADARDAGLRRGFALLDDRLLELVEGEPEADRGLRLFAAAMGGPLALRVDATGAGPLPVRAQLEVGGGDPARATTHEREIAQLLRDVGLEGPGAPELPFGRLEHAVVDDRAVVSLGGIDPSPLDLGSMDLPAGVAPTLALRFDFAQIGPLVEMALAGEPDAEEFLGFLRAFGLFGDDALDVRFAFGAADGVGHVAVRTRNYVPVMEASGSLERAPLTADELGLIPADAVSAALAQTVPDALLGVIEMVAAQSGEDPIEMIHQMTGIHPRRDLFDHLGTTTGWYLSDATGGGGMMSLVMFLEVVSEDDLRATLDYALTALNDLAAMEADGRVESRDWMHGEALCTTLTFPGIPVPLEPSLSIDDGFLFLALSPQGLAAALDQRASRGPGLAASPAFRAAARGSLDGLTSVSFTNVPRRARDGYGLATLVTAALANGVRAPEDTARDPGTVLPAFATLVGPSQATVVLGRIEGDDLVQIGTCDPSVAAQLAATCGSPLVYLIGVGVAAAAPIGMMMMPMMLGGPEPYTEPDWEWEEFEDESFELPEDEQELMRLLDEMDELEGGEEPAEETRELLEALGYSGEEEPSEGGEEPAEDTLEMLEGLGYLGEEEPIEEEPAPEESEEPAPEKP
jgi:hypothetical protein